MEKQFLTNDSQETESLGRDIGSKLKGGEVIQLIGDLGSGKTTFVRGLAVGAGSTTAVSSPTFTISQVYPGRVTVRHFDFYRLQGDEMIRHELADSTDENDVIVMEWADDVTNVIEKDILSLTFTYIDDTKRKIVTSGDLNYEYLIR